MQAVPSLVGSGTAIAAAASGLVFGQPTAEANPATTRHEAHRSTTSTDWAFETSQWPNSLTPARPATTPVAPSIGTDECPSRYTASHPQATPPRPPASRHQRPPSSQLVSPKTPGRRRSFSRQGESSPSPAVALPGPRDSASSHGSWLKRLSVRPLSQHGSARSSLVADSASLTTFSHSSAAPILSRHAPTAPPLPPNKLVKRSPSTHNGESCGDASRRRPRGHLPTLRRPATSHQRSATLQQFRADIDVAGSLVHPKYLFDRPICPEELLGASLIDRTAVPRPSPSRTGWTSFFHSRSLSLAASGSVQSRLGDASPGSPRNYSFLRIICPEGDRRQQRVHLVKPVMLSTSLAPVLSTGRVSSPASPAADMEGESAAGNLPVSPPLETAPSTRTKRSLSATFSSAGHWVSKTSGSLRRPKRGAADQNGADSHNKRHLSNPVSGLQPSPVLDREESSSTPEQKSANAPMAAEERQGSAPVGSAAATVHVHHQRLIHTTRNLPSPPPPRPSPSGLVDDDSSSPPTGLPSATSAFGLPTTHRARPSQPSGSSTNSTVMSQLARGSHYERYSVMESSDGDGRGFTSGDDDDTDFKSETAFDSLRTLASGRVRAVETPLESVYDESPPSTAGNGKAKRLSIHEMIGRGWDEDDKITEEEDDDSAATPVRAAYKHVGARLPSRDVLAAAEARLGSELSHTDVWPSAGDLVRFSLDEGLDEGLDEDWTRDDDVPFNPLSPPSKGSSLSSKGINPNVRLALASIEGEPAPQTGGNTLRSERPLSSLFDWSEPSVHDKQDGGGSCLRPRTAYARPEMMDSRGGRAAMRKGPMPTHVRSQSVPVVHDAADDSKLAALKYGTWGMGTKTVSEDWDEDFEFGGGHPEADGRGNFAVPESIRATQPSVRAHSGQIRELSLLVNDLKRLCRHGRDLNMLNGEQHGLWREAEGIITLASPDEEEAVEDEGRQPRNPSANLDALDASDGLVHQENDAAPSPDAAADGSELAMSRTAVVRERQSPRRRSVFSSPEDDIFGGSWPLTDGSNAQPSHASRPRTPDPRSGVPSDVTGVVRSVMESMHHHQHQQQQQQQEQQEQQQHSSSLAEPTHESRNNHNNNNHNRVHFDTNSLKALVRRAGELRDALSDIIRRADQITQSPARTPRRERRLEPSPAFTRVFDDPGSSVATTTPPRRAIRRSNTMRESPSSPDTSPSSPLDRRVPMMTVS